MPRKPRRCTIKLEPASPVTMRSLARDTSAPHEHKMPVLAALISAALKINSVSAPVATMTASIKGPPASLKTESPLKASSPAIVPTIYPPKRRKREPIKLPPSVANAKLSSKDLRRLKNRIAANRLRQRSQEDLRTLQEQMEYYRSRSELLETIMSGCSSCASLSAMEFGDIELLPAEPKITKVELWDEEDLDKDDDSTVLTEIECVVLDKVLQS